LLPASTLAASFQAEALVLIILPDRVISDQLQVDHGVGFWLIADI